MSPAHLPLVPRIARSGPQDGQACTVPAERSGRRVIEGIYRPPAAPVIALSALGSPVPVRIAEATGELLLPGVDFEPTGEVLAFSGPELQAWSSDDESLSGGGWAHAVTARDEMPAAAVLAFALRLEVMPRPATAAGPSFADPADDVVDQVLGAIDPWFDRFRSWVEVRTGQDLDASPAQQRTWSPGSALRVRLVDEPGVDRRRPRVRVTTIEHNALSEQDLRGAVGLASDGRMPADELVLLRDARAALVRGQARKAVLDAACAAELAAGRMLEAQLAAVAPPLAEALTSRLTLGPQVGLLRAAGVAVPDQARKRLVEVRNAVVHRGKCPSDQEAMVAIHIATALVELAKVPPVAGGPVTGATGDR